MAGIAYTDEEAASLTSEQFNEYMKGGDPLGKAKKKKKEEPKQEKPALGIIGKRIQQINQAAGE